MAIEHFKISKLPTRVDLLKNGSPAVLNQSYPIAEENELSIDNQSGFKGEFLDEMEISVSEDNVLWSVPAVFKIKELVGVNTQESANVSLNGSKNTDYVPYDLSGFPINGSTDRIRITSIDGLGLFLNENEPIQVGDIIFMHQLPNITAKVLNGAGLPYMSISYECGNHVDFNDATQYTLEIDVASLAEVESFETSGTNPYFETVRIFNGLSQKIAVVTLNMTGTLFSNGPASTVTVRYNGNEHQFTANGSQAINVTLDNDGESLLEIEHDYSNPGTPATSNVEVVIDTVDANAANVSVNDSYTSTVNFT